MGILLTIFVVATLLILISGLIVMVRGGELNKKWSNRLMTLRVASQALAIGVLGLIFLAS